jgi:hypothetical protein
VNAGADYRRFVWRFGARQVAGVVRIDAFMQKCKYAHFT